MIDFDWCSDIDKLYFREHGLFFDSSYNYAREDGVLDWHPSDTEQRFNENLKKYQNSSDEYIKKSLKFYQENPISYQVNSEGFRDVPLSTKPNEVDVFLGCSFTFGIGIHNEYTWTHKIAQHTKFPSINAGIGGSGPITHYRILIHLAKRFKIRNLFYLIDFNHHRYEWYYDHLTNKDFSQYKFLTPHCPGISTLDFENILNERNRIFSIHAMFNAVKGLCYDKGINLIPCIQQDFHYFLIDFKNRTDFIPEYAFDYSLNYAARDISHPPILDHHAYYLYFLNKLGVKTFKN